ncbi:WhiB family transcriptional regulator [Mycolicibacterium houstonense]|uniref:WhiB family transcriptional regulator n=1 Tax=Mycolicibacterium houstonense TaxID=146021 RepID=UPI0008327C83|nr:WhiB family transcriptional regulator [Mycolicibacterium houstonense]MCV7064515.1 WhiB family transcriptional regulator [Mycolicibacterium farcinogenes]
MTVAAQHLAADIRRIPAVLSEEWRLQARCRGMDPALFFHPDGERGQARARRAECARAICAQCPVVQACRRYSLERNERFGVWGGVSEEERELILNNPRDRNRHRPSRFGAGPRRTANSARGGSTIS